MSSGGHYTAQVQLSNKEWIQVDDTQITKLSGQQVLQEKKDRQVYMLFYTQNKDV